MNIVLILVSVFFNSLAQILIRKGMLNIGEVNMDNLLQHIGAMAGSLWLWGAMVSFVVSIVLWMQVLSKVEVSFAYPFNGVGYVLTTLTCHYLFGESLSAMRMLGIAVICLGVWLVAKS